MKRHILCFGDSNTHGYCADPADGRDGHLARFNEEERWTCLLGKALGEKYLVVEEGLSGRTTVFDDPLHEGLSGLDTIVPCLRSHAPIELLVIMLGTNDTKERFGVSAACIALGMERLVLKAKTVDCWAEGSPRILVVSPPVMGEGLERGLFGETMGRGCVEKSRQLASHYFAMARRLEVDFLDAAGCPFNTLDHMHLTKAGHAELAQRLTRWIKESL